jgi:hypothetical protein
MTYNLQSNTTVYYTLLLPGYIFRLLGVILRPSIEQGLHLCLHGRDRATEDITRRSPTPYRNNNTQPLQRISADSRHYIQSPSQPQRYWFPKMTISDSPVRYTKEHCAP